MVLTEIKVNDQLIIFLAYIHLLSCHHYHLSNILAEMLMRVLLFKRMHACVLVAEGFKMATKFLQHNWEFNCGDCCYVIHPSLSSFPVTSPLSINSIKKKEKKKKDKGV